MERAADDSQGGIQSGGDVDGDGSTRVARSANGRAIRKEDRIGKWFDL
jgi:hypothetical protein